VLIASITTTGKLVLLAVACTFMLFSLVVAMVVPRRRPTFPGRRVGVFVAVCTAFFAAQLTTVWWVTTTQEVEAAEQAETSPAETGPAETAPAETGTTETETAPGGEGDAAAGKAVFASAGCVGCHTLKAAGATGTIGPNLDDAKPPYDLVVQRVTNGRGVMPSFKGKLSEQQIKDVAAFVSQSAGAS
jgi:mono/diheme cytochrome c family protein